MDTAPQTETDGSTAPGRAASSRRRGRRRGVEIRPGSVKQARLEAGLSLGQVALGDISRTAIYFVETGKAKPSIETLRLIATRTNKPLDFFLGEAPGVDEEVAVAEVERLVVAGENADAIAAGEALLANHPTARTAAYARFFMANALIRLNRPVPGRSHLSAARTYFEQAGDVQMVAECLGWEAGGAMMMQDRSALGLIEEALARCRSLDPVPETTEARLLSILGHVHNERHEYRKAIDAYEQSLAIDADMPDLRRLSYVYGNLMLCYQELGQYSESAKYGRRAMALHETLRDRVAMAWAENNLALLLFKQGDVTAAVRHAEISLAIADEVDIQAGRAAILMTMAELELARSNYYAAARWATAALDQSQRMGETTNVGEAHMWLGRVAAARGDATTADSEFNVAFQIFESVDAADWEARGHATYAEILESRGDLAGANRHLRLALAAVRGLTPTMETSRIAIA